MESGVSRSYGWDSLIATLVAYASEMVWRVVRL